MDKDGLKKYLSAEYPYAEPEFVEARPGYGRRERKNYPSAPGNAKDSKMEPDLFTRAESRFKDWLRQVRGRDGSNEKNFGRDGSNEKALNDPNLYDHPLWKSDRDIFKSRDDRNKAFPATAERPNIEEATTWRADARTLDERGEDIGGTLPDELADDPTLSVLER